MFEIFMPFVIGWLLSMLANPLVRFLERKLCLVRKHSSMVIVAGALALVIGFIYLIVSNGARLLWSFYERFARIICWDRGGSPGKFKAYRGTCLLMHLLVYGMPGKKWEGDLGNNVGDLMGKNSQIHYTSYSRGSREQWLKSDPVCSGLYSISLPYCRLYFFYCGQRRDHGVCKKPYTPVGKKYSQYIKVRCAV